jgi:hypothetical protein
VNTTPKKLEHETDDREIADEPAIPDAMDYDAAKKEALEQVIAILPSYRKTPPETSDRYHQPVTQPSGGRRTLRTAEKQASTC